MQKEWSRREMLRVLGMLSAGTTLTPAALGNVRMIEHEYGLDFSERPKLKKPVTAITLGAGNRGNVYGDYAAAYPAELDIVGVAEPIPIRNERYAQKHNIPAKHRFTTWEHVFKVPKFADAVIITTPDNLHYGPAMQALEMGYHLLLEKPIAQSWRECSDILKQAKKYNRIVAVCHVLRYSPYYRKVKEVMDSGLLGDIISLQHMEPIEHKHMAHSFVRGNWRKADETNPIILAKSCHDLDILRWWIGKNCRYVSSFGSLKWFKEENAPPGSTARCTDGCKVESECPYSALQIYYRKRERNYVFDLPEDKSKQAEYVLQQLKEGPYGRCVYRCDNDQPDHLVLGLEFDSGITASFNMEAFTIYAGRRTRVMGSMGDLVGDEEELYIANFRTGEIEKWMPKDVGSGHAGGDWGLARDWVNAVDKEDPSLLTSTLDASMESHLMAFQSERARLNRTVEKIDLGM